MKIIHLNQIDSTNAYLIRENTEYDDMTFVETDYQTNGKGRENRAWLAQRGENSMFSILIKDKQLVEDYAALSILAALLVRNYLSSYVMDKVTIKWPNDVYVGDKKICGILLQGKIPSYLVIGIGINVNQNEFVGEYRTTPTSLYLETNQIFDLAKFNKGLFIYIDEHLDLFKNGLYNPINEIRKFNYLKGKKTQYGVVVDINDDYSLKVETDSGEIVNIQSGEIKM